jgi:hypothetical protein
MLMSLKIRQRAGVRIDGSSTAPGLRSRPEVTSPQPPPSGDREHPALAPGRVSLRADLPLSGG